MKKSNNLDSEEILMTKLLLCCVIFWYGVFIAVGNAMPKERVPKHPTEDRVKIAIIDTGTEKTEQIKPFLCKGGHISLVDDNPFSDSTGAVDTGQFPLKHGTGIAWLVTQNLDPKRYCILIIKWYDPQGSDIANFANLIFSIKYATEMKASYINLAAGGSANSPMEQRAVEGALSAGIKISAAAGNDGKNLDLDCSWYPACYKLRVDRTNLHIVGSSEFGKSDKSPVRWPYSNQGALVRYYENGTNAGVPANTGTSEAAAVHLNKWIKGEVN
jgi:Subtilase family